MHIEGAHRVHIEGADTWPVIEIVIVHPSCHCAASMALSNLSADRPTYFDVVLDAWRKVWPVPGSPFELAFWTGALIATFKWQSLQAHDR